MALRWGIAFSGMIANDFVTAIRGLPASEHEVIAVGDEKLVCAENFAKSHNIPKAYEGYDQLAKDADVQVVYVTVPIPQHYEVTLLLLNHDKHVLCEKPLGLNQKQAKAMIDLAKEKNLFIMEGIWSRCFPVYREVRKLLDDGVLGDVKYVSVNMGITMERIINRDLTVGATLDLGIYLLQFQQYIFRGLKPNTVHCEGHLNEDGVDDLASAVFNYPYGKSAVITCSTIMPMLNEATIVGSKGVISIPTHWCPTNYILNGNVKEFPLIPNDGNFNYLNTSGLAYEAAEVRKALLSGRTESEQLTHQETLQIAAWTDLLRKKMGLVFPVD